MTEFRKNPMVYQPFMRVDVVYVSQVDPGRNRENLSILPLYILKH